MHALYRCLIKTNGRGFRESRFWIAKTFGKKHIGMTNGTRKITIPRTTRVNPYTLKGIIRDAGLTDEEFRRLL